MNSQLIRRVGALALVLGLVVLALTSVAVVRAQDETVAPAAANVAGELLIFDWNKPVTTAQKGFPWDKPPKQNGNWVSPVNYACLLYTSHPADSIIKLRQNLRAMGRE